MNKILQVHTTKIQIYNTVYKQDPTFKIIVINSFTNHLLISIFFSLNTFTVCIFKSNVTDIEMSREITT